MRAALPRAALPQAGLLKAVAFACLVAAAGCTVETVPAPLSSSVALEVQNPENLVFAAPLRWAVVFTYRDTFVVTSDGSFEGNSAVVELTTPGGDWSAGLTPVEAVTLPTLAALDVYRPRFVVYQDIDASSSFVPESAGGADVIVAVDGAASGLPVGAILDLDGALARMSLEETEAYYAASGGRYTPFVRLQGGRGYLQLAAAAEAGVVFLRLRDSPIPNEQLACGRSSIYLYGDPLTAAARVTAHVDTTLDAASVCGVALAACTSEDLTTLAAPDVTTVRTEGRWHIAQCRTNDRLEALVVHTAAIECADCSCTWVNRAEVFFVQPGVVPPWWPCGTDLDYCDSALPLFAIDAECVSDEEG